MVVRSTLRSHARRRASTLGLGLSLCAGLSACGGMIDPGLPFEPDGAAGTEISLFDASITTPTASIAGDARVPGLGEGGTTIPVTPPGNTNPPPVTLAKDAGIKPPVTPPDVGGAVVPMPSIRDLSGDKAAFLGAPRCDKAGALLCEDFESEAAAAAPDPAVWTRALSTATSLVQVDATRAARGTKSVHVRASSGGFALLENTKLFPVMKNTVYGRMFVWLDALPTGPDNAHWLLASATGSNLKTEVRLDGQFRGAAMKNLLGVGSDLGESGDWHTDGKEPGSTPRAQDWMCLEWLFKGDTSETRVWVDGAEQTSLHTTSTEYRDGDAEMGKAFVHPTYNKLRIGWWLYQQNSTPAVIDLWIDEVIVDDERIGCAL